jgi:hypothetical protein
MPEPGSLQLERAEFDQPLHTTCAACGQPLRDAYYEVNGKVVCPGCHEQLKSAFNVTPGPAGLVRGLLAGAVAAAAGGLVYYLVLRLTGYEFGLIAIAVGFAVGKAVNWGSGGRGGPAYQIMAVALTYLSIVGGYVPVIYRAVRESGVGPEDMPPLWAVVQLAVRMPFLGEVSENFMGWIIIAIGLYEAWKFTKAATFEVSGPHALAPAPIPST